MKTGWMGAARATSLLVTVLTATSATMAATTEKEFDLETTRDLVDVCSTKTDDPLYAQARELCMGYVAGLAGLHAYLVANNRLAGGPMACPPQTKTREEFAEEFVNWANAHPQYMYDKPVVTIARGAEEKYPCPKSGTTKKTKTK